MMDLSKHGKFLFLGTIMYQIMGMNSLWSVKAAQKLCLSKWKSEISKADFIQELVFLDICVADAVFSVAKDSGIEHLCHSE